ncbi:MAG: branched-chain amino acid aminotransferase [Acidimicrobiia bacterium]
MNPPPAFGTAFADMMSSVLFEDDRWGEPELRPLEPLQLHPGAHALHYGSSCFEGLKAHRGIDGVVRLFRMDRNVERMQRSAQVLHLPMPPTALLSEMIMRVVSANVAAVPDPPGSLYVRPTLLGTVVDIGAAAAPSPEALLFVICSPVGDYFAGGIRPLRIAVETDRPRTTPQFGMVKSGANYAMALSVIMRAREQWGVDQVLFVPAGIVQETGATNFLLIDDRRIVTPALSESFLHGVTRDSILRIGMDLGYEIEERELGVEEILEWARRPNAEAALSGTAAVLAPVGTLVHNGVDIDVGTGETGPNTLRLREELISLHVGKNPDRYGWLTEVG